jgi:hypothetical protein
MRRITVRLESDIVVLLKLEAMRRKQPAANLVLRHDPNKARRIGVSEKQGHLFGRRRPSARTIVLCSLTTKSMPVKSHAIALSPFRHPGNTVTHVLSLQYLVPNIKPDEGLQGGRICRGFPG